MYIYKQNQLVYEGRSFKCGTGVLQGTLYDLSIFHSFQPVDLFSLDRNSVFSLKIQALMKPKWQKLASLAQEICTL